jgi:fatty acyl-CoA reductase
MDLCSHLKLQDLQQFDFHDFLTFDLVLYFKNSTIGARRYLMGESDDKLPQAKKKYRKMVLLDAFVKVLFISVLLWCLLIKFDTFGLSRLYCSLIRRYHDY